MKIAVIGVYYAPNLGDAIICDCVAAWLKEKWPSAVVDVIDIENKKEFAVQESASMRLLAYRNVKLQWEYWQTIHHIRDRVYYWNRADVDSRQDFYEEIAGRHYDAAVFAGGQLFMDWLSVDVTEFLKRFEKTGTPVYFNACGAGPAVSARIRELLSCYLRNDNVKLISSRDDRELIERRYLSNGRTVLKTYDPALWASDVYETVPADCRDTIGLGVMYSGHAPVWKITGFWLGMIRELDRRQIPWKMFCNGAIDDYNYASYILKKAGLPEEKYLCECAKTPGELVRQIASFRSLISFRLHSHIVAASLNIPAVAIMWDEKLRFFYRNLGHEERCRTIKDKAACVLKALEKAEKEGYDMELITQQKIFSRQLLWDAVSGEDEIE